VIVTILAIGFLILIHELGHLLAAKLCGVSIPEFSIGFGKILAMKELGGTKYCVRWLLLGGYVKTESGFQDRPPLTRIMVAIAGPASNLLFALIIFVTVSNIGLPQLTPQIGQVLPGKPAAKAGLLPGDKVVEVDGRPITKWVEMTSLVNDGKGRAVRLKVERGQGVDDITAVPEYKGKKWMLGIKASGETISTPLGMVGSLRNGSELMGDQLKSAAELFLRLIGLAPAVEVLGPLQIVKVGADQANLGWMNYLFFAAVLSANFVIFNLLPIPVLDGGLIAIALLEAATGKKISKNFQLMATKISMAAVIALMSFVFLSDFVKLVR